MIVASALLCLAANIYAESRGEPVMGQYAVALVTVNRAGSPERVCETVFKPKQFSWTIGGYEKVSTGYKLKNEPKDIDAWNKAVIIAHTTLAGRMANFMPTADHYHATKVQPRWAANMIRQRKVGNHIFYTAAVSQS